MEPTDDTIDYNGSASRFGPMDRNVCETAVMDFLDLITECELVSYNIIAGPSYLEVKVLVST